LGQDLDARRSLAGSLRAAAAPALAAATRDELDAEYRRRQRRLGAALMGEEDAFSAALDGHATRVRALAAEQSPALLDALIVHLPPVLHMQAVRLAGARPAEEAVAYLLWHRALEGLAARRRR
jgi:hypothetical protein